MHVTLAHTQGFCSGVARAIKIVENTLKKYGAPIYVRHHIVHNTRVIQAFEGSGVIFVEDLSCVPEGQPVILSAHGVAPHIFDEAKKRNLTIIDATCPLVARIHKQAQYFSDHHSQVVLIGHKKHQEIIGISGYVKPELLHIIENVGDVQALSLSSDQKIGYLTQTTLSIYETQDIIDALIQKYPDIIAPEKQNICYATKERQEAVIDLTKTCDLIIICGSPQSSNSNRLKEIAGSKGVETYLIDSVSELQVNWLVNKKNIGISSGASVPKDVVEEVVLFIKKYNKEVQ